MKNMKKSALRHVAEYLIGLNAFFCFLLVAICFFTVDLKDLYDMNGDDLIVLVGLISYFILSMTPVTLKIIHANVPGILNTISAKGPHVGLTGSFPYDYDDPFFDDDSFFRAVRVDDDFFYNNEFYPLAFLPPSTEDE